MCTKDYVEKTVYLNPVSAKSNYFFFQFTTEKKNGKELKELKLIPDINPAFIFSCNLSKPTAHFWGINHKFIVLNLEPETTYFCVKPYATFGTKGWKVSSEELFEGQFELSDVLVETQELHLKIAKGNTFDERISMFKKHFLEYWVNYEYQVCMEEYMAMNLYMQHLKFSIQNIEEITGYSKRYCRKKFVAAYNFSPKKYLRVFRFQNAVRMLTDSKENRSITNIAHENGYFDESHFINDFKLQTQTTPENFRKSINGSILPIVFQR